MGCRGFIRIRRQVTVKGIDRARDLEVLTRGGYPKEPPEMRMNPATAETGMAEMAAFSNGGGFLLRPLYDQYAPVMHKWRQFTEKHAALYQDKVPYAQVGVACFPQQNVYHNPTHVSRVRSLTE
jgi:hypothetical protein